MEEKTEENKKMAERADRKKKRTHSKNATLHIDSIGEALPVPEIQNLNVYILYVYVQRQTDRRRDLFTHMHACK